MQKIDWVTLKINLEAGETLAEEKKFLPKGLRVLAAVAVGERPGKIVDLELRENNNQVSAPMDLSLWERSNAGNFTDGFKPIEITGGSEITARVSTSNGLANDLEMEVVFGIVKEDTSC